MDKDQVYAGADSPEAPFRFNAAVADVFPDMLRRSIPGYAASLEAIGSLAARYAQAHTNCYDLGCSLGAATLALRQGIRVPGCRILAVDNAPAMIERCRQVIARECTSQPEATPVHLILADLRDVAIATASIVVMNYTLQFIDPPDRDEQLLRIHRGLTPGGLFILSEKVVDENPRMEALLVDLHHEHKRRNDYSALEISRKRAALENVLRPETVRAHFERLESVGFRHMAVWLRYFNFVSIVAFKEQ